MKKHYFFLLPFLFLGLFTGCKKVEGCTDPYSSQYNADAEKDDGSCTYNGRVKVWFNYATATNLVNDGVPNVDISIGGVKEGSVSMTKSSPGQPACASDNGFTATVDIGTKTSSQLEYTLYKGGTSDILQSGYVTVKGASCSFVELSYQSSFLVDYPSNTKFVWSCIEADQI